MLTRRALLGFIASLSVRAGAAKSRVRGLFRGAGELVTEKGRVIGLEGDTETSAVLKDSRLFDRTLEAEGEWLDSGRFRVEPVHQRGLFVVRNGKPLVITYWCDVCAIRTYSPGKCMCCQEETRLDLRDQAMRDADPASQNTSQ
jgi:hypothetical protein